MLLAVEDDGISKRIWRRIKLALDKDKDGQYQQTIKQQTVFITETYLIIDILLILLR